MTEDNMDNMTELGQEVNQASENQEPELDPIEAEMLAALNGATSDDEGKVDEKRIKGILTMKVPLIVKVAQKKMCMENVLKLSLGSIIQFDKDVYENIELMVNNQVIGVGQPVKIGENFGLRLLQVGNLENTIKSLGRK